MRQHTYEVRVDWTGNDGQGTRTYQSYRRDHTIAAEGKTEIAGSSDPAFRGDRSRYNPEEPLVAALSSCHMLAYLHLCAVNGITVQEYRDVVSGLMEETPDGGGHFVRVVLKPVVTIAAGGDCAKALALHADAHHACFIANSVNFPVETAAVIKETAAARRA